MIIFRDYCSVKISAQNTARNELFRHSPLPNACSAATKYSAKCYVAFSVTSCAALRQHILPNTSAEYSAGGKCARCGVVLQWLEPSICLNNNIQLFSYARLIDKTAGSRKSVMPFSSGILCR